MKLAMKHKGLCSMSFVVHICVCAVLLCAGGMMFCACKGGTGRSDGVTNGSNETIKKAADSDTTNLAAGADASLQGQPVTRKGYNPQMDFAYDEHDDIDIDENYVDGLCGEATKELETMFGPAEFYVTSDSNEDGSYTINVYYNEKAVSFSDNELEQMRIYINQEYKEVRLSEINIQGW